MKSVIINTCYGGFGLSKEAEKLYLERTGQKLEYGDLSKKSVREDPVLIQIVKELEEKANYSYSKLKIVDIPENVEYIIQEYDGVEWIAEKHRTWR